MTQSYINSLTLQPSRFGEVYGDKDLKPFGEARWVSGTNSVQTQGVVLLSSPKDGGSTSICTVPDGSYVLPADGSALWAKVNRLSGAHTLIVGMDLLVYDAGLQPTPEQDWCQLFVRHSGQIVALGGFCVSSSTQYTKIGFSRSSDYDLIVGPVGNPNATHTDIQAAINDASDGNRILVLEGTYSISAILTWSGKTLTIEGEGWGTAISNGAALARAFSVASTSSSAVGMAGNGSRILNLRLQNFAQSVQLDGGAGIGIRNCVVDIWAGNAASYTAPILAGTGTSTNNRITERVYDNAAVSPTYQYLEYNLSNTTTGSPITYDAKIRSGLANNQGRLKLPVYTTANRTAATGLEEGEFFWDTTTQTLEVRRASSFASFAPVPVGTIINWIGGYFTTGSNATFTNVLGDTIAAVNTAVGPWWKVCDGTALNDSASPIFNGANRYLPNLTDDRFLQGVGAPAPAPVGVGAPASFGGSNTLIDHFHPTFALTATGQVLPSTPAPTPTTVISGTVTQGTAGGHNHNAGGPAPTPTGTTGAGSPHSHPLTGDGPHSHTLSIDTAGIHNHNQRGFWNIPSSPGPRSVRSRFDQPEDAIDPAATTTLFSAGDHTHTGSVGGAGPHSHTVGAENAHTHPITIHPTAAHTHPLTVTTNITHTHPPSSVTGTIGSGSAVTSTENRPKYLRCFMLMRVK